ncbi:Bifunctional solanapyrone synthase [Penicillium rolfsii]|nr:Bifunctional solanapyrone synthase [Penicillium rolfsii]
MGSNGAVTILKALVSLLLISSSMCSVNTAQVMETCLSICQKLSRDLPGTTVFPKDTAYADQQLLFFSQQQSETRPSCFFLPTNASHISHALRLIADGSCYFAVKSGGHATFDGASNSAGGITISLARMNSVVLTDNNSIAQIGAGNRWHHVFEELEKNNVTVAGGRTGSVGVGGLTLGGGISFLSSRFGFVCDNVANYEAVLADGSIIDVNITSFPDLYWALRGGGSNFAIVTRFDMYTHPQQMMWGGVRNYTIDQIDSILDAYVAFGVQSSTNPSTYQITTLYYTEAKHYLTVDLYNTEPIPSPSIFKSLDDSIAYADTTAINWMSNISQINAQNQPDGHRGTYWTATYKLDRELAEFVAETFMEETSHLGNLEGLEARCIMQVITTNMFRHMKKNGGNPLGISTHEYPLMLLNPVFRWDNRIDDLRIMQAATNFVNRVNARAIELGLEEPYLYMNYASQFQDVLHSYGAANLERLQNIAEKYDSQGIFQKLKQGYFKLNGRVGW